MPTEFEIIALPGARDGEWTVDNQRKYTHTYQVNTSDPQANQPEVIQAVLQETGFAMFGGYPNDPTATLTSIRATEDFEDAQSWTVVLNFGQLEKSPNPYSRPAEVWPGFEKFGEKVVWCDTTGKPYRNSAGDPFPDGETKDRYLSTINIRVYLQTYPHWIKAYTDCVNADWWRGNAPETALFLKPDCQPYYDQIYGNGFECLFQIAIDPEGWNQGRLDQGYRKKTANGVQRIKIWDEDENEAVATEEPVLLKDGKPLLFEDDEEGKSKGVDLPPVFLDFQDKAALPFGAVGI